MSYISEIASAVPLNNQNGKLQLRFSRLDQDIALAQAFRGRFFRNGEIDTDPLDQRSVHGIMCNQYGDTVCVFRMLLVEGDEVDECYSAQHYNLDRIKSEGLKSLEIGRFCVHPDYTHPDIFRLAWAEIAKFVEENEVQLLFGCSSFHGSDAIQHKSALSLLNARYLGPESIRPNVKSKTIFSFSNLLNQLQNDGDSAYQNLPPLLRSYLNLGGWVSDHAVVDEELNTVHVFTGVEINKIPANRRKMFRSLVSRL